MNTEIKMEVLPWVKKASDLPDLITMDVTNRDGIQSLPWWNYWTKKQRSKLINKLSELGIHHIEAWFPATRDDPEFDSVLHAAQEIGEHNSVVFWLARLTRQDIENTISALKPAKYAWVHTFIGISDEHISTFSFWTNEILQNITQRVSQIRDAGLITQFSAEDATRTELDFLVEIYEKAIKAGAQIINIPDTLWFYDVSQYTKLLEHLYLNFPNVVISTHTHNDKSQAEQNSIIPASLWFAQRIEWTIYGIWERAWNADIMSLISIIMQDPQYKHLRKNLISNPNKFTEILEYMSKISGIHMRQVAPWYWYEAIVNRSWVHQAKIAKLKESYIAYPGNIFWLESRPQIEISSLSWYNWVIEKFKNSFSIDIDIQTGKKLAHIYRLIFSPDTNPNNISIVFPELSDDFLYQNIVPKIQKIRNKARKYKNTSTNLIRWNKQTDKLLLEVYYQIESVKEKNQS